MDFLKKLESEMERKNIKNLHDLSVKSNIPYTTLRGFYTKGYDKIKLSTLIKLKNFFKCSLDYLCDDSITEFEDKISSNKKEK